MSFAQNLETILNYLKLSNYRAAQLIGCSQTSIANWLSGERYPHKKMMIAIADTFGLTAEQLDGLLPENFCEIVDAKIKKDPPGQPPFDPSGQEKTAPANGDGRSEAEQELIRLIPLVPEDMQAGILAQIKTVLAQRGLLPEQSEQPPAGLR